MKNKASPIQSSGNCSSSRSWSGLEPSDDVTGAVDQSERALGTTDQSEAAVVTWANNSSSCMYRARQSGVTQLRRGPAPSPVCTLGTNYTHIFSFYNSFLNS